MGKILLGFLLIFIDFNITTPTTSIDILPDFLGYIFIIWGLKSLILKSSNFKSASSISFGMSIYTGILFIMEITGMFSQLGGLTLIISIISFIFGLVVSYKIVMGILEIEANERINIRGENLRNCWKVMAFFQIASFLLFFIPMINIILIIGSFITAIVFLVYFNSTKNAYML